MPSSAYSSRSLRSRPQHCVSRSQRARLKQHSTCALEQEGLVRSSGDPAPQRNHTRGRSPGHASPFNLAQGPGRAVNTIGRGVSREGNATALPLTKPARADGSVTALPLTRPTAQRRLRPEHSRALHVARFRGLAQHAQTGWFSRSVQLLTVGAERSPSTHPRPTTPSRAVARAATSIGLIHLPVHSQRVEPACAHTVPPAATRCASRPASRLSPSRPHTASTPCPRSAPAPPPPPPSVPKNIRSSRSAGTAHLVRAREQRHRSCLGRARPLSTSIAPITVQTAHSVDTMPAQCSSSSATASISAKKHSKQSLRRHSAPRARA